MGKFPAVGGLLVVVLLATVEGASAVSPVGLGTATSFAVLGGSTVTNTGPSVISGDLGVSPGTAITGFPPGQVTNGTQHSDTAVARQAQADLIIAYNDAAGRSPTASLSLLGGQTLSPGVYNAPVAMSLTGTVTLDGEDNPDSVFIFQAGSTLITEPNSTVALIRGARTCNVFWQVGSSATLDTNTTFVGTIMALTSATLNTGATVEGRVLARNGAVTLDTNMVTRPACEPATSPTTSTQPGSPSDGNGGDENGNGGGDGTGNGDDTGDGDGTGDDDGNGNGAGGPGSGVTSTTRPGALVPPTVEQQQPEAAPPTIPPDSAMPRTGKAVIPTLLLGTGLIALGMLLRRTV